MGFLDAIPDTDIDSDIITLKAIGFSSKLRDQTITETFTTALVTAIVRVLGINYFGALDINYNETKINLPNLFINKVGFDDTNLWEAMVILRNIVNYEYNTAEYTFGVDAEKDVVRESKISRRRKKHGDRIEWLNCFGHAAPERIAISRVRLYPLYIAPYNQDAARNIHPAQRYLQ